MLDVTRPLVLVAVDQNNPERSMWPPRLTLHMAPVEPMQGTELLAGSQDLHIDMCNSDFEYAYPILAVLTPNESELAYWATYAEGSALVQAFIAEYIVAGPMGFTPTQDDLATYGFLAWAIETAGIKQLGGSYW